MAGFCLEGNVVKRGAMQDTPERCARRAEIGALSSDDQAGLFQSGLQRLETLPIVRAASAKVPARQKGSSLNDWGVCLLITT